MSDFLTNFVSAVFADLAAQSGVVMPSALGATGKEMLDRLLKKRREEARNIMLDALRRGSVSLNGVDLEESVPVLFRFIRAAEEGAARRNLRLLAEVFAGQARHKAIAADEFLYYADILSPLRREEIQFLGSLYRIWIEVSADLEDVSKVRVELSKRLKSELIPELMCDDAEFFAIAASASRTGLVSRFSGWGGEFLQPSPLLVRLAQMVDLEAAAK
ncbi:hypothetical protein [Burkholderia gladioli]|uniref:hypothetical protein n=1 Tax=Burkholderia gladioli TaxID=28095 RepID=UPI001641681E|nr:hypothetical protein [Burkholderia gladioli]MBU9426426.1 hypothetical protein [Burkholderia gladioli]MDN8063505.1 hypothetical protein [Burkholderia gladioli]